MHSPLWIGTIIFLVVLNVCSNAAERSLVTPEQVEDALRSSPEADLFGSIEEGSVVVPSVPVRGGKPELQIVRVVWVSGTSALVELRCREGACLPFVARVTCGAVCETKTRRASKERAMAANPKPMLKRGQPATLVLTAPGVIISVPVVCLEAGARGQRIRVFSSSSRKTFVGRIEGPGLVTQAEGEAQR